MRKRGRNFRPDKWVQARKQWVGRWVWFSSCVMGDQLALVRGITRDGEILLSSDFYEQLSPGGFPLPVCSVEEAEEVLEVLTPEELVFYGKPFKEKI